MAHSVAMPEDPVAGISERLLNGAKLLGQLWRSGVRCGSGWSAGCLCGSPVKFCRAKEQWMRLADKAGRTVDVASQWAFIEAMTIDELEATGLTLTRDLGDLGKVKVGPAGDFPVREFMKICGDQESLKSVLRVIRKFPGSRVTAVEDPPKKAEVKK